MLLLHLVSLKYKINPELRIQNCKVTKVYSCYLEKMPWKFGEKDVIEHFEPEICLCLYICRTLVNE